MDARTFWIARVTAAFGVAALLAAACGTRSNTDDLTRALDVITPAVPKSHVRFLSHDLLRGRDTGDVGYELAKEYVASQFERIGLEPVNGESFLQPVPLLEGGRDLGSSLAIGSVTLTEPEARFTPSWQNGDAVWEGEAVYVGYGLSTHGRNDYAGADVTGKAVLLLTGTPPDWNADRDRARAAAARTEAARRKGAAIVVELAPPASQARQPPAVRRVYVLKDGSAPRVRADASVSGSGTGRLLAALGVNPSSADQQAQSARPVGKIRLARRHEIKEVQSWNVVGIIRGADPGRREESIIFSAHLDHVGITEPDQHGDTICNGAHDNAMGTAKLLAAAEAMVRLRPRRSIVFAAVGAEERGLLGSWHYVRNAVLPIERAVANINQDGGREGLATDDVIDNAADLSDMAQIVREVMTPLGVGVINDRSPAAVVGFSSDHYSFLLAGVPAVDLKPGYTVKGDPEVGWRERSVYYDTVRHRPADNFNEAWTFESGAEMARRAVRLVWHLANMDGMPRMKSDHPIARERGRPQEPFYFGPKATF
jgi:hypothetical protein